MHELSIAWHPEDFRDQDAGEYHSQAREVAQRRDVQVLAVREGGAPVAFAQLSAMVRPPRSLRSTPTPSTEAAGAARR